MPVTIELQNLGDAQSCREMLRVSSTPSATNAESGVCRSPDRAPARIGNCEWKGSTALNGRILRRVLPGSINPRQFANSSSSWHRPVPRDPLFFSCFAAADRTGNEHPSTGSPSSPRTAHVQGSKCEQPSRRTYPPSVEQDQKAGHGSRTHRVAQSQPRPRRSAFSGERSCDLVAQRRGKRALFVLAGKPSYVVSL